LVRLFEVEVPEIQEGIIRVVGAAREPGERAKISVYSQDASIDPIGACVGVKGSRVQAVVQELRGEKIDIIPWSKDTAKFACNALAPARVSKVYMNDEDQSMEIIVNDDQLSLAMVRRAMRLASRLPAGRSTSKRSEVEKTSRKVIDDRWRILGSTVIARVLFDEYLREPATSALSPENCARQVLAEISPL
jgi:N utilization substance protein A